MIEESTGTHDHPGGAEPALDRAVVEKSLLERREPVFRGDSFDGGNLPAFTLAGQNQTGVDRPAIKDNGAGAALADAAAFLGAGEMEIIPEKIKEPEIGIDPEGMGDAINCDF